MPTRTFANDCTDAESIPRARATPASRRQPLSFSPPHGAAEDLETSLLWSVLADDKELSEVLQNLDEISNALKSGKPKAEMIRVAMHPAVWYALKHAVIERELRHLALCDDLTWLYNRRGFVAAATQQLKLARRNQNPAVLLFCDVDALKSINDSFGHHEGDLALVRAADALQYVFRGSDIVARLSGDEFAVLAPDLPARHEQTVLARLQTALRDVAGDETRYELSLSVGAAHFDPQQPVSLGELMERADRAMYERKRCRPNRHNETFLVHQRPIVFGATAAPPRH